MTALFDARDQIRDELRKGQSFVTPGGQKFWPALDQFNQLCDTHPAFAAAAREEVTHMDEGELDKAIECAQRVYDAVWADGQAAVAADAWIALCFLKELRGDE